MDYINYGSGRISPRRRAARGKAVGYRGLPKRLLDIVVALILLVLAAPAMLAAAVAIMLEEGGGVIFRQPRTGVGMNPFVCYKFRTMRRDAPPDRATWELENPEKYITKTGAVLRRMSIDELPQLFNVLKGDMSLVGPRPVIPGERNLIELRDSLGVYAVRPGITGLAQVRGRDRLSNMRKAAYDAQYVERMSFGYDLYLLLLTVASVVRCVGIREGAGGEGAERSEQPGFEG